MWSPDDRELPQAVRLPHSHPISMRKMNPQVGLNHKTGSSSPAVKLNPWLMQQKIMLILLLES